MTPAAPVIGAIVIGRNEGARLLACLASFGPDFDHIIYVDSGSTDGSVAAAQAAGARVVVLDTDTPFTAARARNAGIAALGELATAPNYVQFIDGDCTLDPGWLAAARAHLEAHPKIAVVCGRRRERFPDASIYNHLCDVEWDTPIGETAACGGDALMRWVALEEVGGYDPTLIAGEEPEMCLRMRRQGWQIWRLDAEMTLHDAAMTRFGQFWKRAQRAGHASAEGAAMYGRDPERHGMAQTRRAVIWGGVIPLVILLGWAVIGPVALLGLVVYPAQVGRLALRGGGGTWAWQEAGLLTIGKFAECRGVMDYYWRKWRRQRATLIEYK